MRFFFSSFSSSFQTRFVFGRRRFFSSQRQQQRKEANRNVAWILGSVGLGAVGLSYAAVPLYRMFCQVTGYGGTTQADQELGFKKKAKSETRPLKIKFNSDVAKDLPWSFYAQQPEVVVVPGSTMLAFFKAKNNSDEPVVGVSTYNVTPFKAGVYFFKIQCFCFEEQRLAPGEEVDMPVFFYVDADILDDEKCKDVNEITLSYSFQRAHHDKLIRD